MRRLLGHLHPHAQSLFASLPRKPSIATKLPFLLSRRLLSDAASPPAPSLPPPPPPSADVTNTELKKRLETYYGVDEEAELPSVAKAVLERNLTGAHSETDDDLIEELRSKPLPEVHDRDFESDFEEMHDTDEELNDLYNTREYVEKKIKSDEFFNMDDTKWDAMIKEATDKGHLTNMKECEEILEDMLYWDKLLPDEIKQKVETKFNELGDMCERGEMEPEQAYEMFKEFEDKMVAECTELIESKMPTDADELTESGGKKVELDDLPGEGPVLRWESRIVFVPSGDAYHPKNRKVKLSVTVKELGLSRHAFRRLREVVGKRYNSGKDELTIISERFEHREENRKDCLRTLYTLIKDAMKADKLVEDARNSYVKGRLKANPQFMERLKRKTDKLMAAA
ncbi:hypothetical protein Zm00014a_036023 [Zea mays]|uniref:Ribosomal protein S24/S35 mitochondrial n=2 Tax=Zea mays TaxID=4577 RepID=B6TXB0_MAIZE|nr:uncharacterized protein LOC100277624 [Zea mays]XP_008672624.1 uncharacterized protein LOC100277624 isoform X1 [Zea mays]XP_008672625.1 uncharacterized protein LOC100277624 isoform X1 [Zea mays]ACG41743.1 hypothetical protein [Zea mays]ACN35798.1 unknown [Zea mays]ONM35310.1 Ribosomal protein S24/S35 mitochondrial [Zea mays]PWZ34258.1 hypothetical protein Zm00014a_036023 [Zea mays]PWZ34259.1 hypothetical protein Zm00014a_036023 [Zea mays]|eukprot:NP_001144608.1 uncharacterized protein LOC100277624 [Zea mays]